MRPRCRSFFKGFVRLVRLVILAGSVPPPVQEGVRHCIQFTRTHQATAGCRSPATIPATLTSELHDPCSQEFSAVSPFARPWDRRLQSGIDTMQHRPNQASVRCFRYWLERPWCAFEIHRLGEGQERPTMATTVKHKNRISHPGGSPYTSKYSHFQGGLSLSLCLL